MNKFKVTDPKGIAIDGKHHEKGTRVSIPDGALLDAFLHFKQVSPLDEKPDDEADAKAKAKAEAKAEADVKANK